MATCGSLCAVEGCNSSRKRNKNLSFFYLPLEKKRRKAWAELINRPDLADPLKKTNDYVCSLHFHSSDLLFLPRLQPNALPKKLIPSDQTSTDGQSDITTSGSTMEKRTREISTQTEYAIVEPKSKLVLKFKVGNKTPVLSQTSVMIVSYTPPTDISEVPSTSEPRPSKRNGHDKTNDPDEPNLKQRRLETDDDVIKIKVEEEFDETQSTEQLTFEHDPLETEDDIIKTFIEKITKWRNCLRTKIKGETNPNYAQLKLFALNLYLANPQIYRRLRKSICLPSESIINRFKIIISPKLEDRTLQLLSAKLKSMPENAKYCTLCIDKIPLKRHLHYDTKRDEIIGLHNINGEVLPEIASHAFVIMLRGLIINWKQPIAYSYIGVIKQRDILGYWLEELIFRLFDIGLKVKAIVTEQGSVIENYIKHLKRTSKEKPFFYFSGQKIYNIYDVPHLLKCVRNHLLSNNFIFVDNDKKVSWEHIGVLSRFLDKNFTLIPKITDDHIKPNDLQKTQVKYAAQIFSHSVYAALNFHIENKYLPEEAKATAEFVKKMNNLFDVLNSTPGKYTNKYKRAFRLEEHQVDVLEDALTTFNKLRVIGAITAADNSKRIKTFQNLQITSQAVMMLGKDLQAEGIDHFFTRRLNLETLQKFFVTIRKHSGNRDPSAIQFERVFSKLFLSNLLKNPFNANCEVNIIELRKHFAFFETLMPQEPASRNVPSTLDLKGEIDYRFDVPGIDAMMYVAAYLLYKCNDKHTCPEFASQLNDVPDLTPTLYAQFKDLNKNSSIYGKLKIPSDVFVNYVKELEKTFVQHFQQNLGQKPGSTLYEILNRVPFDPPCDCVPLGYIVKLFLRFRIFSFISANNRIFQLGKNIYNLNYIKLKQLS